MVEPIYRFDDAELLPAARELRMAGRTVPLGARAFDVLLALVTHRERMVGKRELMDIVWPQLVVEENNLHVQVSALRKVLGAKAIVTIPGRGYRFAALLRDAAPAAPTARPAEPPPQRRAVADAAPVLAGHGGNLQGRLAPLLGRDAERALLQGLVRGQRLVSVVGPGGIGKTSLARTVAQQLGHAFADGAWMVPLADVAEPAALPGAVARALHINLPPDAAPHAALAERLQGHELLLLDNCEHLLGAVAALVADLQAAVPALHVLVTSLEPLHLAGEHVVRLEALSVPGPGALGDAAAHGAVALFVARVAAVLPGFQLDGTNLEAVVDICRALDGMPLALEFAAARVPQMGLPVVRQHLGQRLRVLKNDTREAPTRQRTLRATLDWSHALLTPDERKVFRRLGVFVGGFGLELAQEVVADDTTDAWAVLDHLGSLVDKSMVVLEPGRMPRYRMLESNRAYAAEQRRAFGEWDAIQRAHVRGVLKVIDRRARFGTRGYETMDDWVEACGPETDNLRSAIDWASGPEGDATQAVVLVNLASQLMYQIGRYPECVRWMRQVEPLIRADTPAPLVAEFKLGLAMVGLHGGVDARTRMQLLDEARQCFEQMPPHTLLVYTLCMRAYVAGICGDFAVAGQSLRQAEALVALPPLAPMRGLYLFCKGMVCRSEGRPEDAYEAYSEALPYARQGDARTLFYVRNNLAAVHHDMGHLDEAVDQYRAALGYLRASPRTDAMMMAFVHHWYAHALVAQGALDEALAQVLASVPYCRRAIGLRHFAGMLALLFARQGRLREAALMLGCDELARQRRGESVMPFEQRGQDAALALVRAVHGPAQVAAWRLAGRLVDDEQIEAMLVGAPTLA
jgi:predicted ATPase/DNA-binding winged helix-turn-helix (wHTH) protein